MTEFNAGDLVWVHAVTGGTFDRPKQKAYPAVVCKKPGEDEVWLFGSDLDTPAAGKIISKREKSQPEVVTPLVVALTARGYLTEEEGALVGVPPSWIKFKNSEQEDWWCSQEWHKKNYPQHWPDGPELTHRAIALADVQSINAKLELILKGQRDADSSARLQWARGELDKLNSPCANILREMSERLDRALNATAQAATIKALTDERDALSDILEGATKHHNEVVVDRNEKHGQLVECERQLGNAEQLLRRLGCHVSSAGEWHEPADAEPNRQAAAFLRSEGYVFNASNGIRGQWEKASGQGAFSVGDAVWFVDCERREPRAGKVVAVSASPSLCVEELGNGKQFTAYASELAHRDEPRATPLDPAGQVAPEVKVGGAFKPGDRVWFKLRGEMQAGIVQRSEGFGYVSVKAEATGLILSWPPGALTHRGTEDGHSDGVKYVGDHKTPAEEAREKKDAGNLPEPTARSMQRTHNEHGREVWEHNDADNELAGSLTEEKARAARVEHVPTSEADDSKPGEAIDRIAVSNAENEGYFNDSGSPKMRHIVQAIGQWLDETFDAKGRRRGVS